MIANFASKWRSVRGLFSLEAVNTANRFLAIGALLAASLFLWSIFFNASGMDRKSILSQSKSLTGHTIGYDMPPANEWSMYESATARTPLFRAPIKEFRVMGSPAGARNSSLDLGGIPGQLPYATDPISALVLRGLLPGETPQAVLEDTFQQKTYYLAAGQSAGGITVDEIQKDGVILRVGEDRRKLPL